MTCYPPTGQPTGPTGCFLAAHAFFSSSSPLLCTVALAGWAPNCDSHCLAYSQSFWVCLWTGCHQLQTAAPTLRWMNCLVSWLTAPVCHTSIAVHHRGSWVDWCKPADAHSQELPGRTCKALAHDAVVDTLSRLPTARVFAVILMLDIERNVCTIMQQAQTC